MFQTCDRVDYQCIQHVGTEAIFGCERTYIVKVKDETDLETFIVRECGLGATFESAVFYDRIHLH